MNFGVFWAGGEANCVNFCLFSSICSMFHETSINASVVCEKYGGYITVCLSFLFAPYPDALIVFAVRKAYTSINQEK